MSADLSHLNLVEDLEEVCRLPEAARWEIEHPQSLEILVTLAPKTTENERFQARLLWSVYPDEPPSVKFRDPESGQLDVTCAWPKVRGFRPASFDICANWTKEGMGLHPEWRNDVKLRWDPCGNALLRTLRRLQEELDQYFQGRHP
jgi:hypothetical protein